MHPDRLAELEDERRFLLRSLGDLDREHVAGDVDDHDYAVLRDGYTARAATVLRAIDEGKAALPTPRRRRPFVVAGWVVGVLALASLAGWLVARSSGQRLAGQTMTGGQPIDVVTEKLTEARAALGTDPAVALARYKEVLDLDKNNEEALTYTGWLLAISSRNIGDEARTAALGQAVRLFTQVTTDHPDYADAHCFWAVTAARFLTPPDPVVTKAQAQACLDANPPAEMVPMVQGLIDGTATSSTVDPGTSNVAPSTSGG
jgi:hypothetical protein